MRRGTALATGIAAMAGVTVYPSEANFLLVRFDDAGFIYKYLVEKGIIVRNRSSVIDNCIRITVGTRQENCKLLKALNDIDKLNPHV